MSPKAQEIECVPSGVQRQSLKQLNKNNRLPSHAFSHFCLKPSCEIGILFYTISISFLKINRKLWIIQYWVQMDYMNKFTVFMTANYQMHSDLWIHNWEHSLSPLPWERSTNKIIVKWCSEKKKSILSEYFGKNFINKNSNFSFLFLIQNLYTMKK